MGKKNKKTGGSPKKEPSSALTQEPAPIDASMAPATPVKAGLAVQAEAGQKLETPKKVASEDAETGAAPAKQSSEDATAAHANTGTPAKATGLKTVSPKAATPSKSGDDLVVEKRRERGGSRSGSGVSLRKVSHGLQQLSPDAVRLLRELYALLDADGTGSVSRTTLRDMMTSVGVSTDEATLDELFAQTGEPVSFAAYLATMSASVSRLPPRAELQDMLGVFTRADGTIDAAELKDTLRLEGLSNAELDGVLDTFTRRTAQGPVLDAERFLNTLSV